jgi:hypothetical protein
MPGLEAHTTPGFSIGMMRQADGGHRIFDSQGVVMVAAIDDRCSGQGAFYWLMGYMSPSTHLL